MAAANTQALFPQIPLLLEPAQMRALLQDVLFGTDDETKPKLIIENFHIGEKRRKHESFILSYHLDLVNTETGAGFDQILTAKAYRPGQGSKEFARQPFKHLTPLSGVPAVSLVPELDIIIWAFPYDRKLQHLHQYVDTDFLTRYFSEYSTTFGLTDSGRITAVQIDVLHYLPERSCMIRYRILSKNDTPNSNQHAVVVYGKHYCNDNGADVFSNMLQLNKQLPNSARPLHYDPDKKILWQSHIEGRPFNSEYFELSKHPKRVKHIARCVSRFHLCTLSTTGRFGLEDIDRNLNETQQAAAKLTIGLSLRTRRQVNRILSRKNKLDWSSVRETPIHLDLKLNNFLLNSDNAELIDLDCVCMGDHLIDVGSLIANFYLNGLRAGESIHAIDISVEAFIQTYTALIPWPLDRAKLNWYVSAALLHEVLRRSIRQWDEQRLQHVETYLELSERYLPAKSVTP